jgi:hypothetical protein
MMYLFGLASGLALSSVVGWLLWPFYVQRCRLPGETWAEAQAREMSRLDRLAEQEEIPDTQRSLDDRSIN